MNATVPEIGITYKKISYGRWIMSNSLEYKVVAGIVARISTINNFNAHPIKVPVSDRLCNTLVVNYIK